MPGEGYGAALPRGFGLRSVFRKAQYSHACAPDSVFIYSFPYCITLWNIVQLHWLLGQTGGLDRDRGGRFGGKGREQKIAVFSVV